MKIVKSKAVLFQTALTFGMLALPAVAQTPVTVPPANMPAATSTVDSAPTVMPAAEMPVAAAPTALPAPIPAPTAVPTTVTSTTVVAPIAAPVMPSAAPVPVTSSSAVATTPPAGMPTGTPAVVTQVMSNLQDSKSNVSVEDLSKAQDALTRLDLLLQIEKKIGEIKKTQDDRESGGSTGMGGGGMMGQIPASALVLPGQMNGGTANGMNGAGMPAVSPVISSAPASGGNYQIEQISGTNGNYSAILTTPDGDRKTVRAGDKLDGRRVESVSFDSVRLAAAGSKTSKKGGKTLTIHNDTVLLTPMTR